MSSTQKDCKSWDVILDGVFMQRLEYCEDVSYEYACSDLVDNHNYHPNEQGISILRVDDQIEFPFIYVISPTKYAFQLCNLSYQESLELRVAGCKIINGTEYAKLVDQDDELTAIYENRDAAIASLDAQIIKAGDLKVAMDDAYSAAKRANAEAAKTPQTGAMGNSYFAGGAISGGTVATVNELGKEAFLSASGKLSMINAPAWGQWKAPSNGTVIPAHLTKQLDIPKGGVNLNAAAGMNAGKSAGMTGIMAAVRASSGGDIFNQSVTVQSANPTQTANNMMVEMTRLKRRRLGR